MFIDRKANFNTQRYFIRMAVKFDAGSWVWCPDEEDLFLPKYLIISQNSFKMLGTYHAKCEECCESLAFVSSEENKELSHTPL